LKACPAKPPNQRVQPTPLAASEIVRFLKADFVCCLISIYEAARLTRKTLDARHHYPTLRDLLYCS
jgi:hypothetical protein